MLRSGGSGSPSGGNGEHAGGSGERAEERAASQGSDRDLQSALDRLSLSLERIENLLGELHSGRRSRRATGVEQGAWRDHREEPGAAQVVDTGDARVVHGGGPSAFTPR
jgi:hypothetical protein